MSPRPNKKITKGSFATVLIGRDAVFKIQDMKSDSNLNLYTYTDAIISSFVSAISSSTNGLPCVTDIQINKSMELRIQMPNYGITLDEWCKKTSHIDRMADMPILMLQLCNACNALFAAGIQHTDIKPTNILIDPANRRLTLIDYNIYSIQTVNGWTPSVGTWCYVAPEILHQSAPSNTSMCWSIGMIMAEICGGGYVLGDINVYMRKSSTPKRKDWQHVFTALRHRNPNSLTIASSHIDVMKNTRWLKIFQACTRWNSNNRVTLDTLTTIMTPIDPREHYRLTPSKFKADSKQVYFTKSVERNVAIDNIYQFCCTDIAVYGELMYRSIYIYDILSGNVDPAICMCIANVILGYSLDVPMVEGFRTVLDYICSVRDVEKAIIGLCTESNMWDLYWIGADVVAMRAGLSMRNCVTHMPEVMKKIESPYTCSTIVEGLYNCCQRRHCTACTGI